MRDQEYWDEVHSIEELTQKMSEFKAEHGSWYLGPYSRLNKTLGRRFNELYGNLRPEKEYWMSSHTALRTTKAKLDSTLAELQELATLLKQRHDELNSDNQ